MPDYRFQFIKQNRLSPIEMLSGLEWGELANLLSGWKDGTIGYAIFKRQGKPKSPEQLGYYYGVILPHAVEAFRKSEDFSITIEAKGNKFEVELTLDNMDKFLKLRYAALTGKYVNKAEMDMSECSAFEDWAIKWLATWLNCKVPPAEKVE